MCIAGSLLLYQLLLMPTPTKYLLCWESRGTIIEEQYVFLVDFESCEFLLFGKSKAFSMWRVYKVNSNREHLEGLPLTAKMLSRVNGPRLAPSPSSSPSSFHSSKTRWTFRLLLLPTKIMSNQKIKKAGGAVSYAGDVEMSKERPCWSWVFEGNRFNVKKKILLVVTIR